MIRLYCITGKGWMAQDDNPKVKSLFGTDTLPTAFTDKANPEEVLSEIQRLNPDEEVILVGE